MSSNSRDESLTIIVHTDPHMLLNVNILFNYSIPLFLNVLEDHTTIHFIQVLAILAAEDLIIFCTCELFLIVIILHMLLSRSRQLMI